MRMLPYIVSSMAVLVMSATALAAEQAIAPERWSSTGRVVVDKDKSRDSVDGALRVEPGAKATLMLRDSNGAGRVEMWVYEDGTSPKDPKARRTGPHWGVVTTDGRILAAGVMYAPYLAGDKSYNVGEYTPAEGEQPYHKVAYLGLPRKVGWRKWTFDFDAEHGLRILCDGKDVNAARQRFDWNKSDVAGFAGIVVVGDQGKGDTQIIWIDGVTAALAGDMRVTPTPPPPPPPPPPRVPAKDPPLEGPAASFNKSLLGRHPRLLFAADDLPALRAFAKSDAGKPFMDRLREYLGASQVPKTAKFLTDATDGQRQGYWRLPTVALHYVLTGDKQSFERTVAFMKFLLELDHWETGSELDSGMSAANIMVGAALAFDWLHDDLEPEFREAFRRKLLYHARAMYHGGHLRKNPGTHYWQGDPQNNHRWHRNAGMALCVLAAYTGADDEKWILTKTKEDLDYVAKWLPDDGTSHEGPTYMVFGGSHLVIAMDAADRCLDTSYLEQPFFKHVGRFMTQSLTPDRQGLFQFGDSGGGGLGGYSTFLYRCAAVHGLADVQAVMDETFHRRPKDFVISAWMALIWRDPKLTPKLGSAPTRSYFDDLGLAYMRDGWSRESAAAMFKCGPFGGYKLNAFSQANGGKYINVAHDDPDANGFILWKQGDWLAETDRYSKHKQSANHNTVLINGMGQMSKGRPEGGVWSQPGGDMRKMGIVTAWEVGDGAVIIEGEAAGSYLAYTDRKTKRSRPGLDRFRRTFIWVEGRYVLVLDHLRAPEAVEVTWLMQGKQLDVIDDKALRYRLRHEDASCAFQVVSDVPIASRAVVTSSADHRGKALGWRQLQLKSTGTAARYASVYDLWSNGGVSVAMKTDGANRATVIVTSDNFTDTWTWHAANGSEASTVVGTGRGGQTIGRIQPAQ